MWYRKFEENSILVKIKNLKKILYLWKNSKSKMQYKKFGKNVILWEKISQMKNGYNKC